MAKFIDNHNSADESEKRFVIKVTFSIFFFVHFFSGKSTRCGEMSVSLSCTEIHKPALLRKILTSVAGLNKGFMYEAIRERDKTELFISPVTVGRG